MQSYLKCLHEILISTEEGSSKTQTSEAIKIDGFTSRAKGMNLFTEIYKKLMVTCNRII